MLYAIIDIGSNTIRLSVYKGNNKKYQNLFHKKITAGLANYTENGILSQEGIRCACDALLEFQALLSCLPINEIYVFATASLRNIENTMEAVTEIQNQTGYHIELLSGIKEATLGYYGIKDHIGTPKGILFDIGGGSTEITSFTIAGPEVYNSYAIGSLNLYKKCVNTGIFPNKAEQTDMKERIHLLIPDDALSQFEKGLPIHAIGGSARAILRISNEILSLPQENNTLSLSQLKAVKKILFQEEKSSINLILKKSPDRIHTLLPGLMILYDLCKRLKAQDIQIHPFGIREGYLSEKIKKNAPYLAESSSGSFSGSDISGRYLA